MLTPSLSVSKVFENGMIPVKLKKSRAFSLKIKLLRDNMCRFPEKTAKMFESSHRVSGTHIGGRVSASSTVDGRRSFAASRRFSFVSRGWIAIAGRRPASTTSAGLRPAIAIHHQQSVHDKVRLTTTTTTTICCCARFSMISHSF